VHVDVVDDERLLLVSDLGYSELRGPLFGLVAPFVDGRRSADEIVEALRSRAPAAEVYYALVMLEQGGYLKESDLPVSAQS
jgi:oxazoline/thiazoline synthase